MREAAGDAVGIIALVVALPALALWLVSATISLGWTNVMDKTLGEIWKEYWG
jgi:hypothetical protein